MVRAAEALLSQGPEQVLVKLGSQGCLLVQRDPAGGARPVRAASLPPSWGPCAAAAVPCNAPGARADADMAHQPRPGVLCVREATVGPCRTVGSRLPPPRRSPAAVPPFPCRRCTPFPCRRPAVPLPPPRRSPAAAPPFPCHRRSPAAAPPFPCHRRSPCAASRTQQHWGHAHCNPREL